MKIGYYVRYGRAKEGFDTFEDFKKAFEKYAEVLKKYNMELVFWGFPFGVTEGVMCTLKGDAKDFESMFGKPDVAAANPMTQTRTNMILVT